MTSSSSFFVTKDEFHAFHKIDRAIFSRLVLTLKRDIQQSFQVMSFLIFLEQSGLVSNLIANLVPFPDFFINSVADEVLLCLSCVSYEDFSMFVANLGKITNSSTPTIPLITRMTGESLTLSFLHHHRKTILLEMKKHLADICYPAFEDICKRAEQIRAKAITGTNQLESSNKVHKAGSSSQFLSDQQETSNNGASSEDEQARTVDARTVFLTFSRGYPISQEEVHAFFTRRFGDIIESIFMPEVGGEQALYARMVLNSAAKVAEIVNDEFTRTNFTINGKHVKARRFITKTPPINLPPSNGVSS